MIINLGWSVKSTEPGRTTTGKQNRLGPKQSTDMKKYLKKKKVFHSQIVARLTIYSTSTLPNHYPRHSSLLTPDVTLPPRSPDSHHIPYHNDYDKVIMSSVGDVCNDQPC